MPYILNALDKKVSVKVFGKYFEFNPRQIKPIVSDGIALKLETSHGSEGLVAFPEEAMEWDRNGADWKQLHDEKIMEGKAKRLKKLEEVRYNEEVSLKKDLDIKGLKTSPFTFGNAALVAIFQELIELKKDHKSQSLNFEDQLKKLAENLDGDVSVPNTGTVSPGSPAVSQPAKAGK